jgi:predicted transcriptional regulator
MTTTLVKPESRYEEYQEVLRLTHMGMRQKTIAYLMGWAPPNTSRYDDVGRGRVTYFIRLSKLPRVAIDRWVIAAKIPHAYNPFTDKMIDRLSKAQKLGYFQEEWARCVREMEDPDRKRCGRRWGR